MSNSVKAILMMVTLALAVVMPVEAKYPAGTQWTGMVADNATADSKNPGITRQADYQNKQVVQLVEPDDVWFDWFPSSCTFFIEGGREEDRAIAQDILGNYGDVVDSKSTATHIVKIKGRMVDGVNTVETNSQESGADAHYGPRSDSDNSFDRWEETKTSSQEVYANFSMEVWCNGTLAGSSKGFRGSNIQTIMESRETGGGNSRRYDSRRRGSSTIRETSKKVVVTKDPGVALAKQKDSLGEDKTRNALYAALWNTIFRAQQKSVRGASRQPLSTSKGPLGMVPCDE